MPTGTVTVTQGGSTASGTDAYCLVFTGQAASPIGNSASATNTTPSLALAAAAANSFIVGSNLGLIGTWTALGNTTLLQNRGAQGLEYVSFQSTAVTADTNSHTYGSTATVNSISIVELEIKAAAASLAVDGSSPGGFFTSTLTATSASFTPPASSLVVVLVQTNGNVVVTATVTDTGLGLTWTEQVKQNTSGNGYVGIWTAPVPAASVSAGMLLAGEI